MLAGKTVFIVETEILISLSMQPVLLALGADQVLIATSAEDFHHRNFSWAGAALAILEIENNRPDQIAMAHEAKAAGVIVIGISADTNTEMGIPEFPGMPILIKPVLDDRLMAAIQDLLDRSGQNE